MQAQPQGHMKLRPWLPSVESPVLRGRVLRQGVAVLGKSDEVEEVVHSIRMGGLTSSHQPARRKSCGTKGRMDEIGVGVPSLGANG
jgi:hypothetical protein